MIEQCYKLQEGARRWQSRNMLLLNHENLGTHTPHRAVPVRAGLYGLAAASLLSVSCSNPSPYVDCIPPEPAWTTQGMALSAGPTGSWDVRLHGMISPVGLVKKNGTYFLYYLGADGDRSTDGGPRHRALGVATSTDGINFTKYANNPIITHLPHNNEEEGVFSGGVMLDDDEEILLYYGAMDAGSATSELVDSDIRLATSTDGFNFTDLGDVISHADPNVWGYGDELFPVGVFKHDGTYHLFYIAKGTQGLWHLALASGPARDVFTSTQGVITGGDEVIGGGDPLWLNADTLVLFIVRSFSDTIIEARTASAASPVDLSAPVRRYDFNGFRHTTVFLDSEVNMWFLYQREIKGNVLYSRTAPANDVGCPEKS